MPPKIDVDKRIVSTRRERGLAPRATVSSHPDQGDLPEDYSYARDNLYNLIERGNEALEGILELAKEMEHPRAYEVASGLIKNVSDTTMELLKMQKELKQMKDGDSPKTNFNNLYVGSTAELQKFQSDVADKTQESTVKTQNVQYYEKASDKYYQWAQSEIMQYIKNNSKMINQTIAAQTAQQQQ